MSTFLTKTYIYYTLFPITRNITFCRTRSLSNATFSFLIKWRSFTSKSAAVYKISPKSDDFSLKYGDIMIFKMAAVRHLELWIYHKMCSKCQPWTLTQADRRRRHWLMAATVEWSSFLHSTNSLCLSSAGRHYTCQTQVRVSGYVGITTVTVSWVDSGVSPPNRISLSVLTKIMLKIILPFCFCVRSKACAGIYATLSVSNYRALCME